MTRTYHQHQSPSLVASKVLKVSPLTSPVFLFFSLFFGEWWEFPYKEMKARAPVTRTEYIQVGNGEYI